MRFGRNGTPSETMMRAISSTAFAPSLPPILKSLRSGVLF
jgi:hypothetical protein